MSNKTQQQTKMLYFTRLTTFMDLIREGAEGKFPPSYLISQIIDSVQCRVDHQHGVGQRLVLQLTHGKHPVIQPGAGACPEGFLQATNTQNRINKGLNGTVYNTRS